MYAFLFVERVMSAVWPLLVVMFGSGSGSIGSPSSVVPFLACSPFYFGCAIATGEMSWSGPA